MTYKEAVRILMRCAARDVIGAGCGIRSTEEEWKRTVSVAWAICFKKDYGRWPDRCEFRNSGMSPIEESEARK